MREALIEREVLLRAAPHIIWPLRFVLPHDKGCARPGCCASASSSTTTSAAASGCRHRAALDLRRDPVGAAARAELGKAFSYADCWVEDSRLVVLNALDAAERGAEILPRTRCSRRGGSRGCGRSTLTPAEGGTPRRCAPAALVNAAGPWVSEVAGQVAGGNRRSSLRLVKGSHIVVPRLYEGEQAYILQHTTAGWSSSSPTSGDFSPDRHHRGALRGRPGARRSPPRRPNTSATPVNRYLSAAGRPEDVVWSYAGVRPLYDDDERARLGRDPRLRLRPRRRPRARRRC